MSGARDDRGNDGVPLPVRPDDDTARVVVMTRARMVALVRRLCAERAAPPPLPAALAAMPEDDLIAPVRRLRHPTAHR